MLVPLQYDPEQSVDPKEWLTLDEQERIEAVRPYHRRKRISLPNERLHAITPLSSRIRSRLGRRFPLSPFSCG
jgi:hypothetical protein